MDFRFSSMVASLFFAGVLGRAVEPMPDFHLKDENKSSPRYSKSVSPRDHILQVSGYYFGDAG